MRLVLHIGISKTASSTLQQAVFARHPEVFYLGKYVRSRVARGCRSEEYYECLQPVLWEHRTAPDLDAVKLRFQHTAGQEIGTRQLLVASWEGLGSLQNVKYREMIRRTRHLVEDFSVLVCLRNPLDWLPSAYLQSLQGRYLKANRGAIFGAGPYLSFEQWFRRKVDRVGGIANSFTAASNVRASIEMLGTERVGVLLFEELRQDPTSYYQKMAGFLRVDACQAASLAGDTVKNPRLSQAEYNYIRACGYLPWLRRRWQRSSRRERKQVLARAVGPSRSEGPARVIMSERLREMIVARTAADYDWLADKLQLDIPAYGYPTQR